jgi:hypothetical protein
MQQERVDDAEHRGGRADSERQSQNHNHRKTGCSGERARAIGKVLRKLLQPTRSRNSAGRIVCVRTGINFA